MIQYIIRNYDTRLLSQDIKKDSHKLLDQIKFLVDDHKKKLKFDNFTKYFIIVKNFPLELYADLFKKNNLKQENNTFSEIKNLFVNYVLGSNLFPHLLIFCWDDGTGDQFKFNSERLFGKEILEHQLTETIR